MAQKTTSDVILILKEAQSVAVSAKDYTMQQLILMIQQVGSSQRIYIKNAGDLQTSNLIMLAQQAGSGKVVFDFTE